MAARKQNTGEENYAARLSEIAETRLGELTDTEVIELLAERREISLQAAQAEKEKAEEAKRSALLEKEEEIKAKIGALNESISPDKEDSELLSLIEDRKKLEEELEKVQADLGIDPGQKETPEAPAPQKAQEEAVSEPIPEPVPAAPASVPQAEEEPEPASEEASLPKASVQGAEDADFGSEGISEDSLEKSGQMQRYLHELEANRESIGSFLQSLPNEAKKSKEFMLKVAEVDPAYAMHYADKDTLKRDEGFNVAIAATRNDRNSGSALAEMLPEMRTGKVVLAGVKQDYKNVRYALPNMKEYDDILSVAKKGALEKVSELKEAADVMLLVPKILQKDKAFLKEIEKIAGSRKKES